jgi:voltage-gated potassium channel Kch
MAAPPQPGTGRKDRTVTYTGLFRLRDWILLAPLGALGIALGIWGFVDCTHCQVVGLLPMIVKSAALVRGNIPYSYETDPWQLVIAQLLLPGLALFGGIRLVVLNLRRDVRVGLARRQRNHTIVCGLGDSGRQIVENLRARRENVVAVTLDDQEPNAIACERLGVAVLKGDATQVGMLRLAGLRRADTLVITCGSDATNIEIALRVGVAFAETGERTRPLRVLPELRGAWLHELLHGHPTATLTAGAVEMRPFDLAANAARLLLQDPAFGRLWRVPASARKPALQPHLLVAGLGEVGAQIIAQAVQTSFALPGTRLAVTILDQQGEGSAAVLDARYPGLKDLIDRDFVPATFAAENPATWQAAWDAVEQALEGRPRNWTTVAVVVALKDDKDALHTALRLREGLDRKGYAGTPVFVRLREQHQLGQFVAGLDGPKSLLQRVTAFGDLGVLTSPDLLIDATQDRLARGVHETYLSGKWDAPPVGESAVPWVRLPEYLKQSNRAFADHIRVKLGSQSIRLLPGAGPAIALTEAEIEAMSIAEHRRWMVERLAAGWSEGERDPVARHHPDLVPWERLDEPTRDKDRVLVRAIPDSTAAAGMSIRRERIVAAFGDHLDGASSALDAVAADEQAIVIADPHQARSWEFAAAAADRGAKLWLLWHEGSHKPLVPEEPPSPALRDAVELAISAREAAALLPGASPARQPRRRRA